MTGVFVIPGHLLVNFHENGRLRQLQVPLDRDQMIELAGYLLAAASQPQPQPSAQPAAKLREKPEAWRN